MSTKRLFRFDTELTADTVEWCPGVEQQDIAACGTYQLDKVTGKRHGSLSLHKLTDSTQSCECVLLERKVFDYGVLDMKWSVQSGRAVLALATSCGDVIFLSLTKGGEDECSTLVDLGRVVVSTENEKTGLCLSLDWNRDSQRPMVVTSDSLGQISVIDCSHDGGWGEVSVTERWKAHDFEAWIVCFGPDETHTILSGGDDCRLCIWDTRTQPKRPVTTSKEHTMGVCSLQRHPLKDHLFASGSYDERVLVWDIRSMRKPLKEMNVGGGVWRIKWHPTTNSDFMATACMHNGFKVINWNLDNAMSAETVCEYREHESLAYGIDWSRMKCGGGDSNTEQSSPSFHHHNLLGSCSFYDHSLHFWRLTL